MVSLNPHMRLEVRAVVCTLLGTLLVFCLYHHAWTPADWNRPWYIFEDVPLLSGYFQASAEGDMGPWQAGLVKRLNAPFGANWLDFPTTEELLYLFGGLLTRCFGAIAGYNLALLSAHLLAAGCFYGCARWWGASRLWAGVTGFLFACSRYHYVRDTIHINLSFCWHLPLYWVVSRWLWNEPQPNRKQLVGLGGLIWVVCWLHPYYWYFWLLMLTPPALKPLLAGRWRNALLPVGTIFASIGWLLTAHLDTLRGRLLYGHSEGAFIRTLNEQILYQLRLPDLALPREHRIAALSSWGEVHYFTPLTNWALEMNSSYFGWFGVAALLAMFLELGRRASRAAAPSWTSGMVLFLFLVGLGGGLNLVVGALGVLLFRCSCRLSVLLLAGVLLDAALRLSRRSWSMPRQVALALAVCLVAAWDQLPLQTSAAKQARVDDYVANERATMGWLESHLPAHSMVFQWPPMRYPESAPLVDAAHYEEETAYLLSSTLRFSYGNCYGRPESAWQDDLRKFTPQQIVSAAERYGFGALLLYPQALHPDERRFWSFYLRRPDYTSASNTRWSYLLQPKSPPDVPRLEPTHAWGSTFLADEHDAVHHWRWCSSQGQVSMLIPPGPPAHCSFGLTAYGDARPMQVTLDGHTLFSGQVPAGYGHIQTVVVPTELLTSGPHTLKFAAQGPPLVPQPDGRLLAFQAVDFLLQPQEPAFIGPSAPPSLVLPQP